MEEAEQTPTKRSLLCVWCLGSFQNGRLTEDVTANKRWGDDLLLETKQKKEKSVSCSFLPLVIQFDMGGKPCLRARIIDFDL